MSEGDCVMLAALVLDRKCVGYCHQPGQVHREFWTGFGEVPQRGNLGGCEVGYVPLLGWLLLLFFMTGDGVLSAVRSMARLVYCCWMTDFMPC